MSCAPLAAQPCQSPLSRHNTTTIRWTWPSPFIWNTAMLPHPPPWTFSACLLIGNCVTGGIEHAGEKLPPWLPRASSVAEAVASTFQQKHTAIIYCAMAALVSSRPRGSASAAPGRADGDSVLCRRDWGPPWTVSRADMAGLGARGGPLQSMMNHAECGC